MDAKLHRISEKAKPQDLSKLLKEGQLDEYFTGLVSAYDWLKKLESVTPHASKEEVVAVRETLQRMKHSVLDFYTSAPRDEGVIGDTGSLDGNVDWIVLLGCPMDILLQRLDYTVQLLNSNTHLQNCPIVVSGGGWSLKEPESQTMKEALQAKLTYKAEIIEESDSMDTVGNALFTKISLQDRFKKGDRIVVVTSDFHTIRSCNIFKKLFGDDYTVDVVAAPTSFDSEKRMLLARKELVSDAMSSRDIFGLKDFFSLEYSEVESGDHATIFCNLFLHHDLYKFRFDLIRKYGSQIHPTAHKFGVLEKLKEKRPGEGGGGAAKRVKK